LTEVNKDWRCVPTENTAWAATAPWRETRKIQVSNNTTSQRNREHQIGGTILMAFEEVSHRISDRGQDIRGLGRWSSMELNGIGGLKTTIITAYCPVNSPGLGGCYTTPNIHEYAPFRARILMPLHPRVYYMPKTTLWTRSPQVHRTANGTRTPNNRDGRLQL